MLQIGVEVPAQSVEATHWTQAEVFRSHRGAEAGQVALEVQPWRQVKLSGSQIGAEIPQSALERQSTHSPVRTRQRGEPAGQSLLVAHWTH
jgi:hypothetical protein